MIVGFSGQSFDIKTDIIFLSCDFFTDFISSNFISSFSAFKFPGEVRVVGCGGRALQEGPQELMDLPVVYI